MQEHYNFKEAEIRWREAWDNQENAKASGVLLVPDTPLHLGHIRSYAILDASSRFELISGRKTSTTLNNDIKNTRNLSEEEHQLLHKLGLINWNSKNQSLSCPNLMTCETFQTNNGVYLSPDEVWKNSDGSFVNRRSGEPIIYGKPKLMSDSFNNKIDAFELIDAYGADAVRLALLSDNPSDELMNWDECKISGAWKYLNRLWRMSLDKTFTSSETSSEASDLFAEISQNYSKAQFNKAIAKIREFSNNINGSRNNLECLAMLISPITPHLAEEIWHNIGNQGLVISTKWPYLNEKQIKKSMPVQIDGKFCTVISIDNNSSEDLIKSTALNDKKVQKKLNGAKPANVILVPERIINVVL